MRLLKLLLCSMIMISLLTGCGPTQPNPALHVETKSGKGAIMVYRPVNYIWRHKRFSIYINGEYRDSLMDKSHHIYHLKTGEYEVEVREDVELNPESFKLKVDVTKNRTKYLKFGTLSIDGYLKFKRVIRAVAADDYSWNDGGY